MPNISNIRVNIIGMAETIPDREKELDSWATSVKSQLDEYFHETVFKLTIARSYTVAKLTALSEFIAVLWFEPLHDKKQYRLL